MNILPPFMGFNAPAITWNPAELGSSLTLWLDASDISTITKDGSDYVSQWNDKSGNSNHVYQSTGSLQPLYSSSNSVANNRPAIVFPNSATGVGFTSQNSFLLKNIIFICAYKDAQDTTFDGYDTLLSGPGQYGWPRIMGNSGANSLNTASLFQDDFCYKNNSQTSSNTVLPMPLSMLRFGSRPTSWNYIWNIGKNIYYPGDRSWRGVICEVIGCASDLTTQDSSNIWAYVQNKWGIVA